MQITGTIGPARRTTFEGVLPFAGDLACEIEYALENGSFVDGAEAKAINVSGGVEGGIPAIDSLLRALRDAGVGYALFDEDDEWEASGSVYAYWRPGLPDEIITQHDGNGHVVLAPRTYEKLGFAFGADELPGAVDTLMRGGNFPDLESEITPRWERILLALT